MRKLLAIFLLALFSNAAMAEDSIIQVSRFSDPYGNTGSFWNVQYQGKPYKLLKLKSSDQNGEADYVFDAKTLTEFEEKVAEMRRTPNSLKADGVQVLWSHSFADATVRTMFGRLNGMKVKLIQIEQTKAGQPKSEHRISLDQSYREYSAALLKIKNAPNLGK